MGVKRIVTNIAASQVDVAQSFYGDVLGLERVMDLGWIVTFAAQDLQYTTSDQHLKRRGLRHTCAGYLGRGR